MGFARYVGRVGALAVALGVGAAIASTPGAAWAIETESTAPAGETAETSGATQRPHRRPVLRARRRAPAPVPNRASRRTPRRTPPRSTRRLSTPRRWRRVWWCPILGLTSPARTTSRTRTAPIPDDAAAARRGSSAGGAAQAGNNDARRRRRIRHLRPWWATAHRPAMPHRRYARSRRSIPGMLRRTQASRPRLVRIPLSSRRFRGLPRPQMNPSSRMW